MTKISRQFLYFSCFALLCHTMACNTARKNAQGLPTAQELLLDSLDADLRQLSSTSLIPGFSVAIAKDGQMVFEKGYGYADLANKVPFTPQTIHGVASISKTFVGLAILQLVDAGKLRLDEPINDILPYKITNPHHPDKAITVRHLVTHTSTLTEEFDPEEVGEASIYLLEDYPLHDDTPEDIKSALTYFQMGKPISLDEHIQRYTQPTGKWYTTENFLQSQPGEKFDYTNLDAAIAARIVELKSGQSFEEYTRQHIFLPLKMAHTSWQYKDLEAPLVSKLYMPNDRKALTKAIEMPKYQMTDYPSGGLKTNIADLGRYLLEMIDGYQGRGKLLSAASYQTLLQPQLPDSCFENRNDYLFNDQQSVGVFWAISPTGYRLHNGGSVGVYSFIYFDPATKSGAIAFCNLPVDDFGKVREVVHRVERLMGK